jgi:Zn-dependent peptidase ImmA (M78 family)
MNDTRVNKNKIGILHAVFSESTYFGLSAMMIERLRSNINNLPNEEYISSGRSLSQSTALSGSEALNFLRAEMISKYLRELGNAEKTQSNTRSQVKQITQ